MTTAIGSHVITINAQAAAIAWLNAFSASGRNEERPALNRTLSIEVYQGLGRSGVQFIGCDGTALFRTWVPADDGAEWPDTLRPNRSLVVMDVEGFGLAFVKALLAVTAAEGFDNEQLTLTVDADRVEEEPALGEEFQRNVLTLEACGQRIDLKLYDGKYPNWRGLDLGLDDSERVEGLAIAGRLLRKLGGLKGAPRVEFDFAGQEKAIRFRAFGGDGEVLGLVMPMRREDKADPKAEDEEDEKVSPLVTRAARAIEKLRPKKGSGIESVEITSGGKGIRLTVDRTEAL